MHVLAHDPLGGGRGHLLDVHAAGGAGHDDRLARRTIEQQAHVQLALDLEAFLDQHARDDAAFGAGLVRDQTHADHVARDADRLVRAPRELHAAALAPSAGMDLRLDDDDLAAEPTGDVARFIRREGDFPARHGHAIPVQDGLGLVFVDFHGDDPGRESLMTPNSDTSRRLGDTSRRQTAG